MKTIKIYKKRNSLNKISQILFGGALKIKNAIILGVLLLPIYATATNVVLDNPITAGSIDELIVAILEVVVAIATPIAILAIIYCGFLFVKARGKPEELVKARQTLMWTLIGITVLLGAELLSTVISGTIAELSSGV